MGFWGWRPLVFNLFICVLVVACTSKGEQQPDLVPTALPPVTLTLRIPTQSMTLSAQATNQPISSPPYLLAPDPVCDTVAQNRIVCLGLVKNIHTQVVQDGVVYVKVVDSGHNRLAETPILLEQRLISPGGIAPYHVEFTDLVIEDGVRVHVDSVEIGHDSSRYIPLEIIDSAYEQDDVEVRIYNPQIFDVKSVRVVIVLMDSAEQIVVYRLVEVGQIKGGETRRVQVRVVPMLPGTTLNFHAEGEIPSA